MKSSSFRPFSAGLLLLATLILPAQQNSPGVGQSQETLKANTRLVIVDVVATDSHGEPVTDLKAEDFTMLEQGQVQRISHFSFQHPGERAVAVPRSLPPNVVSNAPQFSSTSLNVILFDGINGDFTSQAYARDQLVKFFSSAQLDRPVAVFALESRLRLLHDFTTDGHSLKAAVERYKPPALAATTESIESRASAFTTYGDYHTNDQNIQVTLNQLNALAKILAGYPGRKNLIWLSESFPLDLFPDQVISPSTSPADQTPGVGRGGPTAGAQTKTALGSPQSFGAMVGEGAFKDYAAMVKKLADSMMAAQVAVYPVDAAGVGRNDHLASQHTANNMADRTGGKVFHDSNDLVASMRTSIDDGSTYYTLEYYPDNKKWDGQFRVIQVKTDRPGVSLRYRLGYYAVDPEKAAKDENNRVAEDLSRALELDTPAYTAVHFQAGVVPSSGAHGVLVNFAIDPRSVSFERSNDGLEHARVSCTVWAYARGKDKPVMSDGDTVKADLKPDVYQQMMRAYFPCKRELELKPGNYTLRLAVIDRSTNLMGTARAEVTVPQ